MCIHVDKKLRPRRWHWIRRKASSKTGWKAEERGRNWDVGIWPVIKHSGLLTFCCGRKGLLKIHQNTQVTESGEGAFSVRRAHALPPAFACVDFGAARVSSTPGGSSWECRRCAGGVRRRLKPLPDVLRRPARTGQASSGIPGQQSACKSF